MHTQVNTCLYIQKHNACTTVMLPVQMKFNPLLLLFVLIYASTVCTINHVYCIFKKSIHRLLRIFPI